MSIWESAAENSERQTWWQEAAQDPSLAAGFKEVHEAVLKGELTLAEVGGMTREQLAAAHAGACKLLGIGKVDEAQQIAGYLILIDPYEARAYRLAGHCFHHKRQYALALAYYEVALAFGEDAPTRAAQGEALLMLGRREEARGALQQALQRAGAEQRFQPFWRRAQHLLATYLPQGDA